MTHSGWVVREDYTCPSCGQPELVAPAASEGPAVQPPGTSCSNPQCSRWERGAVVSGPDTAETSPGA